MGLNTKERAGILVLVSRLINLEDTELRKQYIEELKGENEMAELNWLEEYFRNEGRSEGRIEGRSEGIAIGEARGQERTVNAAIDFMRSNGMSNEQINAFRNSVLSH